MFGNGNTTRENGVNVNTRFYSSFGDTACLLISGWNQYISIRIMPKKGVDANGLVQYDRDHVGITSISLDNAAALYEGIEKVILPEVKKLQDGNKDINDVSVSIRMGDKKTNVLSVEIHRDENDVPSIYLSFYQRVNENGIADPNFTYSHKFITTEFYKDYNPMSGDQSVAYSQTDFLNFVEVLKNRKALMLMDAHATKYETDNRNAWSARARQPRQNGNGYNNYNSYNQAPTTTNTYSNMDDMELPFD